MNNKRVTKIAHVPSGYWLDGYQIPVGPFTKEIDATYAAEGIERAIASTADKCLVILNRTLDQARELEQGIPFALLMDDMSQIRQLRDTL